MEVINIRNREKQREAKKKRKNEELLDTVNSFGMKDMTPYNAVKSIKGNLGMRYGND